MGAGAAHAIAALDQDALWRGRGDFRGDSSEHRAQPGCGRGAFRGNGPGCRRPRGVGREIRQPGHPRSHFRARDGHPCRAARKRPADPLPHRRHPARGRRAAAIAPAAERHHLAPEGDGPYGHCRKAPAAGWPDQPHPRPRSGYRRARLDDPHGERREHLAAPAHAHRAAELRFRPARPQPAPGEDCPQPAGPAERNRPGDRPDRVRQIDLALLLPLEHQLGPAPDHYRSRSRWNTASPASRRST